MQHLFTTRIKHNDDGIFELDIERLKLELPEGYKCINKEPVIRIDVAYVFVGVWCTPVNTKSKSADSNA